MAMDITTTTITVTPTSSIHNITAAVSSSTTSTTTITPPPNKPTSATKPPMGFLAYANGCNGGSPLKRHTTNNNNRHTNNNHHTVSPSPKLQEPPPPLYSPPPSIFTPQDVILPPPPGIPQPPPQSPTPPPQPLYSPPSPIFTPQDLILTPPPGIPVVVIKYKQCMRNHAVSIGGHALDGCCEFMPSPSSCNPTDPTTILCAACGCHRNFHRPDPDTPAAAPHQTRRHCLPPPAAPSATTTLAPLAITHSTAPLAITNSPTTTPPAAIAHPPTTTPPAITHTLPPPTPFAKLSLPEVTISSPKQTPTTPFLSAAPHLVVGLKKGDPNNSNSNNNRLPPASPLIALAAPTTFPKPSTNGGRGTTTFSPSLLTPTPPTNGTSLFTSTSPFTPATINTTTFTNPSNLSSSNSGGRAVTTTTTATPTQSALCMCNGGGKRHRSRFSHEQKTKMCEFSAKLGWKIQKVDKSVVDEFCNEVGVGREVFRVWMHNNKHTFGRIGTEYQGNNSYITTNSSCANVSTATGDERFSPVVLRKHEQVVPGVDDAGKDDGNIDDDNNNNGGNRDVAGERPRLYNNSSGNNGGEAGRRDDDDTGDEFEPFQLASADGSSSSSG